MTPDHKNDLSVFFISIGRAFAAQDFAKQRSLKAKAAAVRRQRQGLPAGRAPGAIVKSKLDDHETRILFWLSQEISKSEIARRLAVSTPALTKWLDRRDQLICDARSHNIFEKGMALKEIKQRLKLLYRHNDVM